jgi:DNA-binding transcriptional LysR family regulator
VRSRQLDCALIGSYDKEDPNLLRVELGEDRLFCAVWSGSELAQAPLSLERYLAAAHVQISVDGVSEGLADTVLKGRGIHRKVVATIPNYLVLPWVLRGTELLTHCGENLLQMIDETSEITFLLPPLPIPPVTVSFLVNRQMITDPATLWLRSLFDTIFKEWEEAKKHTFSTSKFVRLT